MKDSKRKLVGRLQRAECGLYCRTKPKGLIQNNDPAIGLLLLKNQMERRGDRSERGLRRASTGLTQAFVTLVDSVAHSARYSESSMMSTGTS